jgi:hypothetical protein
MSVCVRRGGGVASALIQDAIELECWDESFWVRNEVAHFEYGLLIVTPEVILSESRSAV